MLLRALSDLLCTDEMKRTLAIINLIASIPVIVGVFGRADLMLNTESLNESNRLEIIGGADGPTKIFLPWDPEPFSILALGVYAGLFILNGFVFWKSKDATGPDGRPSQAQSG